MREREALSDWQAYYFLLGRLLAIIVGHLFGDIEMSGGQHRPQAERPGDTDHLAPTGKSLIAARWQSRPTCVRRIDFARCSHTYIYEFWL